MSKINLLRSEAQSLLNVDLGPQMRKHEHDGSEDNREKIKDSTTLRQEYKALVIGRSNTFAANNDFIKAEKELKVARDENRLLQGVIVDRGQHDQIISRLETERNALARRLEDELFTKNEARRQMEVITRDALEKVEKSKAQVEFLNMELKGEKDCHDKVLAQLKSSHIVLKAELESQREYLDELRAASWTDLAAKVKAGVEAVTSRELAKSSIGVAQAVTTCEERWKRRLEEVSLEDSKEMSALRDEHHNEMRYKNSQFQIQLEEVRVEVEDRLQKKHTEALKATLKHKESQRQVDVKNEIKRWEQVRYCVV